MALTRTRLVGKCIFDSRCPLAANALKPALLARREGSATTLGLFMLLGYTKGCPVGWESISTTRPRPEVDVNFAQNASC